MKKRLKRRRSQVWIRSWLTEQQRLDRMGWSKSWGRMIRTPSRITWGCPGAWWDPRQGEAGYQRTRHQCLWIPSNLAWSWPSQVDMLPRSGRLATVQVIIVRCDRVANANPVARLTKSASVLSRSLQSQMPSDQRERDASKWPRWYLATPKRVWASEQNFICDSLRKNYF